jgi:hypothetical protein
MNKKLVAIPALILVGAFASFGLSTKASAATLGLNAGVNVQADTAIIGQNPGGPMMHVGATTSTTGTPTTGQHTGQWMQHAMNNGIFGTVTAINGDTITVQSKMFTRGTSSASTTPVTPSTTYTVDATNAKVDKDRAASTVSNIAIGDNIVVVGTVSGTNVTATTIHDALALNGGVKGANGGAAALLSSDGQPVIGGTVSAVNGDTITITNKGNTSYTIDVTNAKITKNGTTSTASNIAVGDSLLAQGTVNGTSVTAVNVIDSVNTTSTTNGTTTTHKGFFGAIGNFFAKIF